MVICGSALVVCAAFGFRCFNRFWGDLPFALSTMFLIQITIADARNRYLVRLSDFLAFVGKHSFQIFAVHTFFITVYGNNIIYKLNNPLLIYAALVAVSLLTSVGLVRLKDFSGITFLQKNDAGLEALLSYKDAKSFDQRQSMKIKGAAISLLVFHHLFYSEYRLNYGGIKTHLISRQTLMSLGAYARICVWLFVFVSAYGLAKSYFSLGEEVSVKKRWEFYKHHYFSLMNQYWFLWVIIFLVSFLFSVQPAARLEKNVLYIALDFLGWSDFFGTPSMNHSWWYMCLAQMILLFLPVFCEMIKKWGGILVVIVFLAVQFLDMNGIVSRFGGAYVNYLMIVLLGIWIAESGFMEKLSRIHFTFSEMVLLLAGIYAGIYWNRTLAGTDVWGIGKALLSVSAVGICIFIFLVITEGPLEKVLVFLGRYSGNMFFIHTMLFDKEYLPQIVYWSHNVLVSWLVCMLLSLMIFIVIEYVKKYLWKVYIGNGCVKESR